MLDGHRRSGSRYPSSIRSRRRGALSKQSQKERSSLRSDRYPPVAKSIENIRRLIAGEVPAAPVATLIGFAVIAIEPGRAVVELEAGPRHANPMGTLHGGILCDVADAAMGIAYASELEEGESLPPSS